MHTNSVSPPGEWQFCTYRGLGHAYTTYTTVKNLLERTKLYSSCFKSYRNTILVCSFSGYVSWGVLFSYLQVGYTHDQYNYKIDICIYQKFEMHYFLVLYTSKILLLI